MARKYTINRQGGSRFKIDYERQLDVQQVAVAMAGKGPLLVIAGAGSGKTRTVTYRVARLLESGVSPERLLLVTFTNKAAREMLKRVDELLGTETRRIWGGTFHSIGNRILRQNAERIGYTNNFTILDGEDAKDLIEIAMEDAAINIKEKRYPKAKLMQEMFSLCVNKDMTLEKLLEADFPQFSDLSEKLTLVRDRYQLRKKAANSMDYDDLLVNWLKLLTDVAEVREALSAQFEYIMVDEYQDTNKIQCQIIDLLAQKHRNLMVVGDDAQSIYAFRGAHFANIYEFSNRYADATVLRLENNYRSLAPILDLANAAIAANERQFAKTLVATRKTGGELPALVPLANSDEQSAFIASRVLELHDQGTPLSEIAVLYRSHWHSLELQLELTRRGIPYTVRSGMRFFEQAHIKDVVSYLKIVHNPKDETAWKRVLRLLPGVGRVAAAKIWDRVVASDDPWTMIQKPDFSAKPKSADAWKAFGSMLGKLAKPPCLGRPSLQIELVLDSGYDEYLTNQFENAGARSEDLRQLANYAARYESLDDFLSELALVSGDGFEPPGQTAGETNDGNDSQDEQMILSSIHQAKGLEWAHVFLIWASDGKFPSGFTLNNTEALEEERRLFYVAVTRAKDDLYLTYPLIESDHARMSIVQRPSRFITELDQSLLESWTVD